MGRMDETFFERVLRQGLNDETITSVRIKDNKAALPKGANFLSELSRVSLEYFCNKSGSPKKKDIELIVKCEPIEDSPGRNLIVEQNIFSTEFRMFSTVLPGVERLLGKRLSPKFYYGSTNPGVIVMEDLAPLGFKTKDRLVGLSMDHMLMVLENMAQFHAASVVLCERNPNAIKSFTEGIMTERTPKKLTRVIEKSLQMVYERIRCWPDPIYSQIADKLSVIKDKYDEEILKATDYDETEFCVLNHGDCWINNILFRENEHGEPLEVVLLDYQMSVYSSPVIDLLYFLGVCPEADLHTTKNDYLIREYLRFLKESMTLLGCKIKPPSFEEIEKAMLKRRMWAIMAAVVFRPRMLADVSQTETFDEILENGDTNMDVFLNPTATTILQKVLPMMNEKDKSNASSVD